jgi:hypothetical protein
MAVSTESFEILRTLARHRVDFIVVGMTAAVLQGAPAFTFDLDIVYRIAEDNVQGLLNALGELEAEFRTNSRLEQLDRLTPPRRLPRPEPRQHIPRPLRYASVKPDYGPILPRSFAFASPS